MHHQDKTNELGDQPLIKAVILPSLCLAGFLSTLAFMQMPSGADDKSTEKPKPRNLLKLETTMPILTGTEKVGYCEVRTEVTFGMDTLAAGEARLYDALLRLPLDEEASPEAKCAFYMNLDHPEIFVEGTEFTRTL